MPLPTKAIPLAQVFGKTVDINFVSLSFLKHQQAVLRDRLFYFPTKDPKGQISVCPFKTLYLQAVMHKTKNSTHFITSLSLILKVQSGRYVPPTLY